MPPDTTTAGDPRRTVVTVLNAFERRRLPLDPILAGAAPEIEGLAPKDRALFNALVYGVLRWRAKLDWIVGALSTTPFGKVSIPIRNILRMALYQMTEMNRIPDAAAIHTAVDLAKSEGGPWVARFVNAVLRAHQRRKDHIAWPSPEKDPVRALAVVQSHPEWLVGRWIERYGRPQAEALCRANNKVPGITLRVNRLKTGRDRLADAIRPHADAVEVLETVPDALMLQGLRTPIARMPAFVSGDFQVQDVAAQLVGHLVAPLPGERVIDACAGRGGKTGHLAQVMENRGEILAVDADKAKLDVLCHEMDRLGVTCIRTAVHDLTGPSSENLYLQADRVLVDAPCSGLGVLRRHPDGKWLQEKRDLERFGSRQGRILDRASAWVKAGGVLVYAVCSLEPEEGEAVVRSFLDRHPDFGLESASLSPVLAPYLEGSGTFRTLPHRDGMDGFFGARFRHHG